MKLAIVGSRSITNYEKISEEIDIFIDEIPEVIISGGAKGVDSLAEKYAYENNIEILIFKPDWKKFGKSAGVIRNKDIIQNSTHVLAFWDGSSKGTLNL